MRLRTTAPPTDLPTTNAARGGTSGSVGGSQVTVQQPERARERLRRSAWNVRRSLMRQSLGRRAAVGASVTTEGVESARLGRKALAPLGTTGPEHRLTSSVAHARAEP